MADSTTMSADQLKAILAAQAAAAAADAGADDKTKGRQKAAREWVAHYIAVKNLRTDLIESGLDPELFTAELGAEKLVELWTAKSKGAI
jgi:hypothetical protein